MMTTTIRNILILALIVGVGYIFVKEISNLMILRGENNRILRETEELEIANEELSEKIEAIKKDPNYVEKLAREELGMIREGDKVYRFAE